MRKYLVLSFLMCFIFTGFAVTRPVVPVKKSGKVITNKVTHVSFTGKAKKISLKRFSVAYPFPESLSYTLDGNPAYDGMYITPGTYTLHVNPDEDATGGYWDIYLSSVTVNWSTQTDINFTYVSGDILFKCYITNSAYPNHWEPFGFTHP